MSILRVTNLVKTYGKQDVLKDVNIQIDEPGIYAVIGPNGSGKTTLFNTISNLLKPTSGDIEVVGKKNTDPTIFYEVSFLKDNSVLYSYLTGYDHLSFLRSVQDLPKERVDEVVEKMQVGHFMNKKVGDYSLGMKQQLLIAMAMLNKPKLMILDEPFNGLDPTAVIKVRHLLKELAGTGTAILISSHTLSEIDLLSDQILFLKKGQIVEEKLDLTGKTTYKISFDEKAIEQLKAVPIEGFDYTIEEKEVKVNSNEQPISDFLSKLYENKIDFLDISKIKSGSEERYMEMFPEEMAKIGLSEGHGE